MGARTPCDHASGATRAAGCQRPAGVGGLSRGNEMPVNRRQNTRFLGALLALAMLPAGVLAATVGDSAALAMTRPHEQIVASDIPPAHLTALLQPVDAFYGFWVNGSPTLLARAIGADFVDHTLPHGGPQGPTGPAQASKGFLAAVPDLNVARGRP